MRARSLLVAVPVLGALAAPLACGTSTSAGTVGGMTLYVASQAAIGTPNETGAAVLVFSRPWTCEPQSRPEYADSTVLQLLVASGGPSPLPAGRYEVLAANASGPGVSAFLGGDDSTCTSNPVYRATSGDVTITAVDSSGVKGTYNLTFGENGTLAGSLDAPFCPSLDVSGSEDAGAGTQQCVQ